MGQLRTRLSAVLAKLRRCRTRNYDPVPNKLPCRTKIRTPEEHEAAIQRYMARAAKELPLFGSASAASPPTIERLLESLVDQAVCKAADEVIDRMDDEE